jgi:hypothetical protein
METKEFDKAKKENNSTILVEEYLNQLSIQEKKAFQIAKNHLGSSFHIIKSNGYNEWLKKL